MTKERTAHMPRTDNLDVEAMTLIRRLTLIGGGGRLEVEVQQRSDTRPVIRDVSKDR
jgi:hypothetical protein